MIDENTLKSLVPGQQIEVDLVALWSMYSDIVPGSLPAGQDAYVDISNYQQLWLVYSEDDITGPDAWRIFLLGDVSETLSYQSAGLGLVSAEFLGFEEADRVELQDDMHAYPFELNTMEACAAIVL